MTYAEWCKQVAKLVRESNANTVITGEDISHGPINYLDKPKRDFDDGVTPLQAAAEIERRIRIIAE